MRCGSGGPPATRSGSPWPRATLAGSPRGPGGTTRGSGSWPRRSIDSVGSGPPATSTRRGPGSPNAWPWPAGRPRLRRLPRRRSNGFAARRRRASWSRSSSERSAGAPSNAAIGTRPRLTLTPACASPAGSERASRSPRRCGRGRPCSPPGAAQTIEEAREAATVLAGLGVSAVPLPAIAGLDRFE